MSKFELSVLNVKNLKEIEGIKDGLLKIVDECPFIEITDNKTYDSAKVNRTKLLTASTDLEKQGKTVKKVINDFKNAVDAEYLDLAKITRQPYEKQQAEVKRFEDIKEQERLEKIRIAEEREAKIRQSIQDVESSLIEMVNRILYTTYEAVKIDIDRLIDARRGTFEEFNVLFDSVEDKVNTLYENKKTEVIDSYVREQKQKQINEFNLVENTSNKIALDVLSMNKENHFELVTESINKFELMDLVFSENSEYRNNLVTDLKNKFNTKKSDVLEQIEKDKLYADQQAEIERIKKENDLKEQKAIEQLEKEKKESIYKDRVIELMQLGFFQNNCSEFINQKEKFIKSELAKTPAHKKEDLMELTDSQFNNYIAKVKEILNAPDVVEQPTEPIVEVQDKEPQIDLQVAEPKKYEAIEIAASDVMDVESEILKAFRSMDIKNKDVLKNQFYYGTLKNDILRIFSEYLQD